MMKQLNEGSEMKMDNLVYDYLRLIDAKVVVLQVSDGPGVLKRGQLVDFDSEQKKYSVHEAGGTANCVVFEDTEYAESDSEIPVTVYISGDFRKSSVITDVELDVADEENLRNAGIVLK